LELAVRSLSAIKGIELAEIKLTRTLIAGLWKDPRKGTIL